MTINKFLVALIPFAGVLINHFAGSDADVTFVWTAAVSALVAAGVYLVPNQP